MVMIRGYSVGAWLRAPFTTLAAYRADALGEVRYPGFAATAAQTTPRLPAAALPGAIDPETARAIAAIPQRTPSLARLFREPADEVAYRKRYIESEW